MCRQHRASAPGSIMTLIMELTPAFWPFNGSTVIHYPFPSSRGAYTIYRGYKATSGEAAKDSSYQINEQLSTRRNKSITDQWELLSDAALPLCRMFRPLRMFWVFTMNQLLNIKLLCYFTANTCQLSLIFCSHASKLKEKIQTQRNGLIFCCILMKKKNQSCVLAINQILTENF